MQTNIASEPQRVRFLYVIALVLASLNGMLLAIVLFAVASKMELANDAALTKLSQSRPALADHQAMQNSGQSIQVPTPFVAASFDSALNSETNATDLEPARAHVVSSPTTSKRLTDDIVACEDAASPKQCRGGKPTISQQCIAQSRPHAVCEAPNVAGPESRAEQRFVPSSTSAVAGPPTRPAEAINEGDSRDETRRSRALGTAFDWEESIAAAGTRAAKERKLMLVLHVSGNFELPEFT